MKSGTAEEPQKNCRRGMVAPPVPRASVTANFTDSALNRVRLPLSRVTEERRKETRLDVSFQHDLIHGALVGITDRRTSKSYRSSIRIFCDWAGENDIVRLKDLKGRRVEVLNTYSKYLQERGYSSGSVHTLLAPICKALGVPMAKVKKPRRRAGDITKRRLETANLQGRREAQQERFARSVALSKASGARRAELGKLTYRDLMAVDESGYRCVQILGGKHGKDTLQRLTPAQIEICDALLQDAKAAGLPLDSPVLVPAELKNHIDYHSFRADRARQLYDAFRERIATEGRAPIIRELVDRWNAFNPTRDKITIRDDGTIYTRPKSKGKKFVEELQRASHPYWVRQDNRARAIALGRPIEYDRLALLAVSAYELAHWRVDVTVTNYML